MIMNNGINTCALSNPCGTETEKTSQRTEVEKTGHARAAALVSHAQQVALSSTNLSLYVVDVVVRVSDW